MTEPESENNLKAVPGGIETASKDLEPKQETTRPGNSGSSPRASKPVQFYTEFEGPLPPPRLLDEFGRVDPSFPERIVAMAELAQQHRHQLENRAIEAEVMSRRLTHGERREALFAAVFIFVALLCAGVWVALSANAVAGAAIITAGVVAIPATVWWNKHSSKSNRPANSNPDEE